MVFTTTERALWPGEESSCVVRPKTTGKPCYNELAILKTWLVNPQRRLQFPFLTESSLATVKNFAITKENGLNLGYRYSQVCVDTSMHAFQGTTAQGNIAGI